MKGNEMTAQNKTIKNTDPALQTARRMGFWSAILTALAAAGALGIAVTTAPARSGPFCLVDPCVNYPYTDAAAFVPNDYYWMVPAFLMGPLFVMLVLCIHQTASRTRQLFSQIAVAFAVISAAALIINYYIQLTVIQSSFLKGELDALTLFSQYNPHGIFIALEDIGYLMMGAAFLFLAGVFNRRTGLDRVLRILFLVSSILITGGLLFLSLRFGHNMEYRFEVLSLLVSWFTLIITGPLLSVFFKRIR
jgi:hypothetical protein